ncbi:MAG: DUF1330 domain-containing protein [Rhizobiaceae bacterium]|nr:DUF1330 domain-containing protein [Rhizobiaceae bacterium]
MTHTSFSKETYLAFKQNDRPGPIHMLNLVRLRDKADYPDGREATGRQAYDAYSAGSAAVLKDLGGSIVWRGSFEQMVIGPQEEQWDICFIAEYPSVKAFTDMLKIPAYREAMAHRQAGVADSRLVRLAPMVAGDSFGD